MSNTTGIKDHLKFMYESRNRRKHETYANLQEIFLAVCDWATVEQAILETGHGEPWWGNEILVWRVGCPCVEQAIVIRTDTWGRIDRPMLQCLVWVSAHSQSHTLIAKRIETLQKLSKEVFKDG